MPITNMTAAMMQANAMQNSTAPGCKPVPAMQLHSEILSRHAINLHELNRRLGSALDRIVGPMPEGKSAEATADSAPGVLHVAEFEARRISTGLDDLSILIGRLEQIA